MAAQEPEALAMFELANLAIGWACVDAATKRARVRIDGAGPIEPGRFLLLITGDLAEVEEGAAAVEDRAGDALGDRCRIARVAAAVWPALRGTRRMAADAACVGIVEGISPPGLVFAADRAVKDAQVALVGITLTGGMGGKAVFAVTGAQPDVEAALDAGRAALGGRLVRAELLPRPTPELLAAVLSGPFAAR